MDGRCLARGWATVTEAGRPGKTAAPIHRGRLRSGQTRFVPISLLAPPWALRAWAGQGRSAAGDRRIWPAAMLRHGCPDTPRRMAAAGSSNGSQARHGGTAADQCDGGKGKPAGRGTAADRALQRPCPQAGAAAHARTGLPFRHAAGGHAERRDAGQQSVDQAQLPAQAAARHRATRAAKTGLGTELADGVRTGSTGRTLQPNSSELRPVGMIAPARNLTLADRTKGDLLHTKH